MHGTVPDNTSSMSMTMRHSSLAERALRRLGYNVTTCTQATQAIALFRTDPSRFDLRSDRLDMPGMSGMELARELLRILASGDSRRARFRLRATGG